MNIANLRCEYMCNPLGIDTLRPRLSWTLESDRRCEIQTAYQILVSSSEVKLQNNEGDLWDSGKVLSSSSIQIAYDGIKLKSMMHCCWKVRVWDKYDIVSSFSNSAYWEMGLLCENDWKSKWIGLDSALIQRDPCAPDNVGLPSPFLRCTFSLKKSIKEARVYSTAIGIYKLYLNGDVIGNDEFSPGWTDYNKRIQYQTYDVTQMLSFGENAIGAVLGDGWYQGNIAIAGRCQYENYPLLLLLQMIIEYTDGTIEYVVTDGSWKGNIGPIRYSDMQMGEYYDARKELTGWSNPGYDDSTWLSPDEFDVGYNKLTAQIGPAVKVKKELKPVAINHIGPEYIFDLGQNMVGRVLLKVIGPAGTRIQLRFGEMINMDGSLYTENLRTAAQTDIYILKGSGIEYYEPRFTFHGFRYIEITGYPGVPDYNTITGRVMYSALQETIAFDCSNGMINKLCSNILWGQRGNFFSIPTDCPQRDERMGWTGDGQIFARTACFNMDCSTFYNKWMTDIVDAQQPSGAFTDVAPYVRQQNGDGLVGFGNAAWGDAGVIIPWTMYLCYNDKRIIEENYGAMKKWIDYLEQNSNGLLRPDGGYGDWLSINADTPRDVMGTAYFAYSTILLSNMAKVIGKIDDANKYEKLFEDIKSAFNKAYVNCDGRIKGDTQTCYVLALRFNLLNENIKALAAEHLAADIKKRDLHLSTGFVGVSYLLPVLSEMGYNDIAYSLLLNDTYPSWGYSIKNGATTIWERWNSYTKEKGFGDIGMNSFNHYSLGSVGEWLYRYVAGIDISENEPGYSHIKIKPTPDPENRITFINAEYNSINGRIVSRWNVENNVFNLYVKIPANTIATVYIPCINYCDVTESNIGIEESNDIRIFEKRKDSVVISIGSGEYFFNSRINYSNNKNYL